MAQLNKRKQSKSLDDSEGEVVQGRWVKEEHQRFVEALSLHGKNWKKVEEYVGTRSGAQIRSHAQKFFNRLEKEFHKQINGLKSSEIKEIFVNKMFHQYSEDEQMQIKQKNNSIMDVSEDEIQLNAESMQAESNQQQQQIKAQLQQGILDLNLPEQQIYNPTKEQVTLYWQQQLKIQKKLQDVSDMSQIPDELLKEICNLHKEKGQIMALQQIQNAYKSISEIEQIDQNDEQQIQQQSMQQEKNNPTNSDHKLSEESRPGNDESFFHFIMVKISKYLNNRKLSLSDLINVPKSEKEAQKDSHPQIPDVQQEAEGQKSRKQSFTFYNDLDEENEVRYLNLKKTKKD
ncbi:unnamed protein product (macronuclear) [Paramecium tetraurelia]|uniref:Uncharacterized protein n=1 Tax=Paramecium tetraurelia TaxID=5888 RepID=A0C7F2_PARTE|nr:uncharacterized protein GSPATT00035849001 [Paramecium tetraurelia]CAK66719.1 unnamed protein product [Paramecium tetraurelia]|eukprot:XP_001434116.1 hypothetical protein (macronuclear) [Paramecium tetraurelia strain d4-2]